MTLLLGSDSFGRRRGLQPHSMEGLTAELLKVFDFEGCPVRTVHGDDGEPWFVARDVAEVLGLGTAAVGRTVDADERGLHAVPDPRGHPADGGGERGWALRHGLQEPQARGEALQALGRSQGVADDPQAYVTDAAAASDPILAQAQMLIEMRLKQIAQEQRLAAIEQRIDTLPAPTTHLSVLAFANLSGIRLDNRLASVLGKHCAALTRLSGGIIGAVPDEHYGTVGNYPLPVLRQVFAAAGLIPDEHLH